MRVGAINLRFIIILNEIVKLGKIDKIGKHLKLELRM
jgi:hypothetical protein